MLHIVLQVANDKAVPVTFGQAKKIASRLERRFEHAAEPDPLKYVLDYWDETGEIAIENVQKQRNDAAAARRLAA